MNALLIYKLCLSIFVVLIQIVLITSSINSFVIVVYEIIIALVYIFLFTIFDKEINTTVGDKK